MWKCVESLMALSPLMAPSTVHDISNEAKGSKFRRKIYWTGFLSWWCHKIHGWNVRTKKRALTFLHYIIWLNWAGDIHRHICISSSLTLPYTTSNMIMDNVHMIPLKGKSPFKVFFAPSPVEFLKQSFGRAGNKFKWNFHILSYI